MDISAALAPKSDQLDAADLMGSPPQVFTITAVSENDAELAEQQNQPVNITLAEFPRVWRPSKGMLRVLADNWGKDVKVWAGRQVELYCDPDVYVGREKRGGTRISRLSHIDSTKTTLVNPRGGKGAYFTVKPLPAAAPPKDWDAVLATALGLADVDELKALWARELVGNAPSEVQAAITARVAEIKAVAEITPEDAFTEPVEGGA